MESIRALLLNMGENDGIVSFLTSSFSLLISSSFSRVNCSICFRSLRMTPFAWVKISS
jgi:hypothetical protein